MRSRLRDTKTGRLRIGWVPRKSTVTGTLTRAETTDNFSEKNELREMRCEKKKNMRRINRPRNDDLMRQMVDGTGGDRRAGVRRPMALWLLVLCFRLTGTHITGTIA